MTLLCVSEHTNSKCDRKGRKGKERGGQGREGDGICRKEKINTRIHSYLVKSGSHLMHTCRTHGEKEREVAERTSQEVGESEKFQ